MGQIDWSKAPEGYDYWIVDNSGDIESDFHRLDSGKYMAENGTYWPKDSSFIESGEVKVYRRPISHPMSSEQPGSGGGESVKWDGKGFPPTGSELEWRDCGGIWHEAKCIGFDGPACVLAVDGEGYKGECHITNLRPIRSHKERVIEAAMAVAAPRGRDGYGDAYGWLYDAGMLTLPEDSQ